MFSCNHDAYSVSAVRLNDVSGVNYDDYDITENYSPLTSNGVFTNDNKVSFENHWRLIVTLSLTIHL